MKSSSGRPAGLSTARKQARQTAPADRPSTLPSPILDVIRNETDREEMLTRPRAVLIDFIRSVSSPLLILGAGGKMGPTLALLAKRAAALASHPLQIIAVSRFSNPASKHWFESRGITTLTADLLSREAVAKLPDATDVLYLVGLKFGTTQNPALTWAANTIVPTHIAERYARSRIAVLSTGNVYPLVPVQSGGAREDHPLTPLGEYANAAVARERIFEYFSREHGTRTALLRLSYAVELHYGVLADIARKVYSGEPIDLTSGYFNCIWQRDANEMILRALPLAATPPEAFNLHAGSACSVREVAAKFSAHFGRPAVFAGREAETALLSNAERLSQQLGAAPTSMDDIIRWIADWTKTGGHSLNKPTHFEVRDGVY